MSSPRFRGPTWRLASPFICIRRSPQVQSILYVMLKCLPSQQSDDQHATDSCMLSMNTNSYQILRCDTFHSELFVAALGSDSLLLSHILGCQHVCKNLVLYHVQRSLSSTRSRTPLTLSGSSKLGSTGGRTKTLSSSLSVMLTSSTLTSTWVSRSAWWSPL